MRMPQRPVRSLAKAFVAAVGLIAGLVASAACQSLAVSGAGATTLAALPTWNPTGNLNTPRTGHTATLLPNGKVLVVAGSTEYPSAELYDTATGGWSATGSLHSALGYHTAALLQDGKVLVVGPGSAELYDITTGSWSAVAPIWQPTGATVTRLANGKVLMVGAYVDTSEAVTYSYAVAELYDPAAATWRPAGVPSWARSGHTATLLQNGNVLVVGGAVDEGGFDNVPSRAELYNPISDSWREVGADVFRAGHTATLLPNGKVLIAGGNNPQGVRLYDPATETFIGTGYLTAGRFAHTATLLPNGKVLIAAGLVPLEGGGPSHSTDLYDPDTGSWASSGNLNTGRWGHTATLLPNGRVLVAGGVDGSLTALNSAELYQGGTLPPEPIGPAFTGTWFDPAQSGHGLFVEVLSDERFLAWWFAFNPAGSEQAWFGGVGTYSGSTATITDVYQPTGGRWIPNFDPTKIVNNAWGSLTFTFTDCNHGKVEFASTSGYGAGSMNLTRLTQPAGLSCP